MKSFTSAIDWETLKIGPDTALTPKERENAAAQSEEEVYDL